MLTTHYSPLYYKKELASGQGTFRKPRKQTKLSQSSKHKHTEVPKQITLSSLSPGMSVKREWKQGRGREEKHYKAGVLVSTKADFFLEYIKNLLNKEILGVPPIFIT